MANQKILVTGMSGQIGGIIRSHLGDTYELSGIDIKEAPDAREAKETEDPGVGNSRPPEQD